MYANDLAVFDEGAINHFNDGLFKPACTAAHVCLYTSACDNTHAQRRSHTREHALMTDPKRNSTNDTESFTRNYFLKSLRLSFLYLYTLT